MAVKDYRDALKKLKKRPVWTGTRYEKTRWRGSSALIGIENLPLLMGRNPNQKATSGGERVMKAKEYLHQAYRLDKRIQSNIEEMERLRELIDQCFLPSWGERIQTQRHTDALFVRYLSELKNFKSRLMMR